MFSVPRPPFCGYAESVRQNRHGLNVKARDAETETDNLDAELNHRGQSVGRLFFGKTSPTHYCKTLEANQFNILELAIAS